MTTSACCVWDLTGWTEDIDEMKKWLKQWCKAWCFQQEECPTTGKLHLQIRCSLKVKVRRETFVKRLPTWLHCNGPTSNENKGNYFYVMKEETRVAGPWSDKDKEMYIPRQVREIDELFPWQKAIIEDAEVWNTRNINIIIDDVGHIGKSILVAYIRAHGIGKKLVYCNEFKDIMRMVMCMGPSKLYLVDIPKAIKKDRLFQLYAALEEVKNGYAFDDRYEFKDMQFDCPNIWVFTNTVPDNDLMSNDRWRYWEVSDNELHKYPRQRTPEEEAKALSKKPLKLKIEGKNKEFLGDDKHL